jgi:hypothetical protein
MFGWFSEARTCASRRNRASRSGSDTKASGSTFRASSRLSAVWCARQTFYEAGGCQVPWNSSVFLHLHDTRRRSRRSEPLNRHGACGGGEHNSRFTVTLAARSHARASVAGGFRIDGAFGSDVPSIRVGATHRSTRNSFWKPGRRVPPSYPRFRAGTRSSRRGRATSSCARGAHLAPRADLRPPGLSRSRPLESPRVRHTATAQSAVSVRARQSRCAAAAGCRGQTSPRTSA